LCAAITDTESLQQQAQTSSTTSSIATQACHFRQPSISPPALRVEPLTPSRRKAFVPKFLSFLSHFDLLVRVAISRS
jgi:hypothetical protein